MLPLLDRRSKRADWIRGEHIDFPDEIERLPKSLHWLFDNPEDFGQVNKNTTVTLDTR
ncbi:MAG TPA: hypothetical protein P5310_04500 [bacterium]|nr:hypothetical protein [bacterium]